MKNKEFCEEIQIALYSDLELTAEQKNHIKNCENCRALLSQISRIKSDLGTLSVPGLADGKITKLVMEKVNKENSSVPFPKFKLTHRLGTAAAIVIILAAVLVINNPSVADFESENNDTAIEFTAPEQNNHILGVPKNEADSKEDTEPKKADGTQVADSFPESENTVLRASPMTETNTDEEDEESSAVTNETTNSSIVNSIFSDEAQVEEVIPETDSGNSEKSSNEELMMYSPSTSQVPVEDSYSTNDTDYTDSSDLADTSTDIGNAGGSGSTGNAISSGGSGGSGRAGGDSSAKKEATINKSSYETTLEDIGEGYDKHTENSSEGLEDDADITGSFFTDSDEIYIFDGVKFSQDEKDFKYNISLANARLCELYGEKYILSFEKLISLGIDNKMLLEYAPMVTDKMLESYSGLLDVFE